ncbi:hypothetical protein VKT23_010671 [Stygiomarasmius scandens]|uniref:F-box domain-containing protein n=1 Tax=Marasmiellus scandens TaxID=2682957 RepID=A0ABR1JGQ2_9AGAR
METSITVRTGSGSLYGNVLETVQPSGSEVYQMPVEVLGEIFKIYCCVEAESEDYVFDGIAAPALVLCQVCRTWRDVAEDLPSLWTDIRIDAGTMRETDLRALSAYLSLSRNRALKISVEYRTSLLSRAPNLVTEVLNDTFKALLTHSSRWKSLSMKNIFVQLHKVGSDQLYGFPMLEELRLPPNLEVASLDILNSSPKLHKLTLPSFSSLASVLCPLQGVTHLTIARSILTGEGEWQMFPWEETTGKFVL